MQVFHHPTDPDVFVIKFPCFTTVCPRGFSGEIEEDGPIEFESIVTNIDPRHVLNIGRIDPDKRSIFGTLNENSNGN